MPAYTVSEEIDAGAEPETRKKRVEKDSELQGRPLSEIIYLLRSAATHFISEIDMIPGLLRPDQTFYIEHDIENNITYVIEKTINQTKLNKLNKEKERLTEERNELKSINLTEPTRPTILSPELKKQRRKELKTQIKEITREYDEINTMEIPPLREDDKQYILLVKKNLFTADFNIEKHLELNNLMYKGQKYHLPFFPRWNKNENDDIRLMQSIAGASLIRMSDIMRNYADYDRYIDNVNEWRALFLKMEDATRLQTKNTIVENPSLRLNTYKAVRDQAESILRNVNNVENKMTTLFSIIRDVNDNNVEELRKEAEQITIQYNRDESTEDGRGRNNEPQYGGLDCQTVINGVPIAPIHRSQREFDLELARDFSGSVRNSQKAPPTYQERVRLLNSYLSQNLRFAFKTSVLPLYVERPTIEFTDRWKGAIRGSIERYSTNKAYSAIIESYRDILLPTKNDPIIALFAEFLSKRADNTQMTMRPYQNNYALTHHQLDRNKIQYKAKEKEMDTMISRIFPDIRKKKRARF